MKEIGCIKEKRKLYNWSYLVHQTAIAANLSSAMTVQLKNSIAARIIARTAYLSNCIQPERMVVANLTTLIAAVRCKKIASHKKSETTEERILALLYFPRGHRETVIACSILLQILSLNDHRNDFAEDLLHNKYNPLLMVNYELEIDNLITRFMKLDEKIQRGFEKYFDKAIKGAFWWQ